MSAAQSLSSIAAPTALLHSGANVRTVGTAMALMSLVAMFQMMFVGGYADRGYLRLFLIAFPMTTVLGIVPFLTVPRTSFLLALGVIFGGLGGGAGANSGGTGPYQPAEYAWIARNYPTERRNRLISGFSARAVAGVVFASGIAVASPSLSKLAGFGASVDAQTRLLVWLVGGFALVAAILGAFVKTAERKTTQIQIAHPIVGTRRERLVALVWPKQSRALQLRLSLTNGLNGVAIGAYGSFLTPFLILRFHASPSRLGFINLAISATAVFGDLACPTIAKRLGLVRSVVGTRVVQSLLIIPIALSTTLVTVEGLLVLRQVIQRLSQPLRDSYSLSQASEDELARISATSSVVLQGAQSVSSQSAGQVIARIGFTAPFIAASIFQLASSVVFYCLFSKRPPPEEIKDLQPSLLGSIGDGEVVAGHVGGFDSAVIS